MLVHVVAGNPDDRVLQEASRILTDGRLLCLPADSNWVVLADPYNKDGVERLYRFRQVESSKHFTLFCADLAQAAEVAHVTDANFRLMKRAAPGPFTFILKAQKKTAKHLKASRTDHQVGVRIPDCKLLSRLLRIHAGPAISSHLTPDMLPDHPEGVDVWGGEIEDAFSHSLAMVIDPGEWHFTGATTVVDLSGDEGPVLVREGVGDVGSLGLR